MSDLQKSHLPPTDRLHEPDRIATMAVVSTVGGLVLLPGLALALVYGVTVILVAETPGPVTSSDVRRPAQRSTGPQLIPDQHLQLEQLREREDRVLQEYKWLDRERDIARIPIRRAMEILAERKLRSASHAEDTRDAK